jgi:hypothetical protein
MKIGADGAAGLVAGERLDALAERLDYPAVGVVNLAVIYGGLRFHREGHSPSPPRWSRRVLFRRGASRQNSDAQ